MTEDKAIIKIIADQTREITQLEIKLNQLQSKYNILKRSHLKFLEESSERRIKDAEKVIKLKQDFNKLLELEQNKGWNEL